MHEAHSPIVRDARRRLCDGMLAPHFLIDLDASPETPALIVVAEDPAQAVTAAFGAQHVLVWTELPAADADDAGRPGDLLRVVVTADGTRWLAGRTNWPDRRRRLRQRHILDHLTMNERSRLARMPRVAARGASDSAGV